MLAPITPPPTTATAARFTFGRSDLVPELPLAGKHHGDVVLIGGSDHVCVANRSPRLDDRRYSGVGSLIDAVAEREERVGAKHCAAGVVTGECGFVHGKKRCVDP